MIVLVGLIAGWLPGQLVTGGRFGVIGDVAIGIVGGLIGSWLLATPGLHCLHGACQRGSLSPPSGAVIPLSIVGLASGRFPETALLGRRSLRL